MRLQHAREDKNTLCVRPLLGRSSQRVKVCWSFTGVVVSVSGKGRLVWVVVLWVRVVVCIVLGELVVEGLWVDEGDVIVVDAKM